VLYDVVGVSVTAARLVQAVLGVVTVALIGLLAGRLFGRRAGFAAAAIAAVYPPLVLAGGSLLTESLSLPLVVGGLLLALEHRRRGGLRWAVLAGLVTGVAVLTRENSVVLLAPLALLVWVGRPRFRLASLVAPAALVIAAGVVVLPWTVRNWARFDTVVPVTDSTGFVWAGVYNPDSAANDRFPAVFVAPVAVDSYRPLFADPELDEVELAGELQSRARDYARDHPSYVAEVIGWNTLRMFDLTGREFAHVVGASLGYSTRVSDAAVAGWYLVAAAALVGLFVAPIRRTPLEVWFAPLLFWATTVLALGTYRYRAPIEPFVLCLAGCAVVAAHDRLRRRVA
jgi:hypothetical protein